MDEVENLHVSPAGQEIAATLETTPAVDHGLTGPQDQQPTNPGKDTADQLALDAAPVLPLATMQGVDREGEGEVGKGRERERELEGKDRERLAALHQGNQGDQSDGSLDSRTLQHPPSASLSEDRSEDRPAPTIKPKRPVLQRDGSASLPPRQPATVPPPQPSDTNEVLQEQPGSLTLAQLKELRAEAFPQSQIPNKLELSSLDRVYDFDYHEAQPFPVEIEEWFTYSDMERMRLRQIHATFKHAWSMHATPAQGHAPFDFTESPDLGMDFITQHIAQLKTGSPDDQTLSVQVLCYIALGNWEETAGRTSVVDPFASVTGGVASPATYRTGEYQEATFQIQWIINTACLLARHGAVTAAFQCLNATCHRDLNAAADYADANPHVKREPNEDNVSIDLWCALTLMYLFIEIGRLAENTPDAQLLLAELGLVQTDLLRACMDFITQMRWDDATPLPSTKIFLLTWKSVLLCFGDIDAVEKVKASFRDSDEEKDKRGEPVITASPLDYHLFRQEICSKYPAYQPPPPVFPFEPENNTILPPLRHRQSKLDSIDSTASAGPGIHGASLMHQPVHIATPAPSPPPSPAAGGKGGKKHNYQTNQMFPFLYPPLDSSSNDLGGKGATQLQDALAGRQWRGSDVPTSILEAADLFSKRMKATRAMKQLWETRIDFMKFERGWKENQNNDDDVDDLCLDGTQAKNRPSKVVPQTDAERRLEAVATFYRDALPNLQSVVGVMMKRLGDVYGDLNVFSADPRYENGNGHAPDGLINSADHINITRTQEIMAKAVSGLLLLLLKWFRVSHVLRYEYLTQLLLDLNYVPIFIKIWSLTDFGRACHYKLEREERNFFNFCRDISRNPKLVLSFQGDDDSDDEAIPPPIRLRRDEPVAELSPNVSPQDFAHPPEVDELGYPQTPLPFNPITNFSYRNTFTFINHLRILQKITRRKAHRSLLLVSYKSSNLLRKSLRVPVDMMRYYTLKLFKSQVPYCGRKWRQTNMKIITAVWLSVPAELRDDWLTGGGGGMGGAGPGDIDGTVEEALPLEQSLRALTHWWNVRTYPDIMGVDQAVVEEEQDFFAKELDKLDLNRAEEELLEDSLLEEAWAPLEAY